MSRLWLVPANDLEALTLIDLLRQHGERVLVSAQPWGASWAKLEPALQQSIAEAREDGSLVYGVELSGPAPPGCVNIDHHRYQDEDRWQPLASLEQVAQLLGIALTEEQQWVAINDRDWIPGLQAAGVPPEKIAEIRRRDRAAQGVTPAQEAQAARDVAQARREGPVLLVDCPDGISSAHDDLAFGRAPHLLFQSPARWSYSGPLARALSAQPFAEQHWSGGSEESGYWGIERPGTAAQAMIRDVLRASPEIQ